MGEPQSPEGAEESLFHGDNDDVDFVREAGDIARLASLQVDTAPDDPEEALVSPPRPLVRVTSGGYIDGRPPPSPRGGPVLKEPKTARDRVWAFVFALQVLGAVGVMVLKARSVDASPIVACALVAVMASLLSPSLADKTVTVEVMPRMALRNSLLTGSGSIFRQIIMSITLNLCLLYTSPSPRDQRGSRMPSSA